MLLRFELVLRPSFGGQGLVDFGPGLGGKDGFCSGIGVKATIGNELVRWAFVCFLLFGQNRLKIPPAFSDEITCQSSRIAD